MTEQFPMGRYTGGEGNRDDVVPGGPPQVLDHLAIGDATERDDPGHVAWIASHQHNVTGFDGDIRSGSNRDPDICRGEGRGIVYAIANHRDPFSSVL